MYGSVIVSVEVSTSVAGLKRGDRSWRTPASFVGTSRWFSPVPPESPIGPSERSAWWCSLTACAPATST